MLNCSIQGLPEHAEPGQVLPSPKMILPEHAEPEQVLPSPKTMILPDMNVPVDMNEIEQVNHQCTFWLLLLETKKFDAMLS